ncbi:Kynureninase (L-kynurenine hydrolase) [Rhizina undulata]
MDSNELSHFVKGDRISFDSSKASTRSFAEYLDLTDTLSKFRSEFLIPSKADLKDAHPESKPLEQQNDSSDPCIYLCGNSLGLQPKSTRTLITTELSIWATRGVHGHFNHPLSRPWASAEEYVNSHMAAVIGALPGEVSVMGSLTANIHVLFASFYKPDKTRYKIIIEGKAFPSDHYAMESQIQWHGLDPKGTLIEIFPDGGEKVLTTEQILRVIDQNSNDTAVMFLSGVQYYTGQLFDVKTITQYAQKRGIIVGWDFAHAAGNVPLELHEWGVDFAAWCSYKYLCSGPGGIAGIFVHDKHASPERHRLAGWWGHDRSSRFKMENVFNPIPGAAGYQLSNPSILDITALYASLEIFSRTSMAALRAKSKMITGYLEHLLHTQFVEFEEKPFIIITPGDPEARGAQLSLLFREGLMLGVYEKLTEEGIVVDERKPDVIRVAPMPLYNTFVEVWEFVEALKRAVEEVLKEGNRRRMEVRLASGE